MADGDDLPERHVDVPEEDSGEQSFVSAVSESFETEPIDVIEGRIDDVRSGEAEGLESSNPGGCLMYMAITAAILGVAIVIAWLGGPRFEQAPEAPLTLQYEDTYNSEGQLIPIPGEWEIYNEAGVAGCADDVELETGQRRGFLELVDPDGQKIRVRPPDSDWTELELISSSETEAVYSGQITRGVEFTLVFSSSSTLGARLEGCADRGGQGWLEEPAG